MVVASNPIVRQLDKDGRDHENTWNDTWSSLIIKVKAYTKLAHMSNQTNDRIWNLFWNLFFIYKKN